MESEAVAFFGQTFVQVYHSPIWAPCVACEGRELTQTRVHFSPRARSIPICATCRGATP